MPERRVIHLLDNYLRIDPNAKTTRMGCRLNVTYTYPDGSKKTFYANDPVMTDAVLLLDTNEKPDWSKVTLDRLERSPEKLYNEIAGKHVLEH